MFRKTMQCFQAELRGVQTGWTILEVAGKAVSTDADVSTKVDAAIAVGTPYEMMFAKAVCIRFGLFVSHR